MSFIEQGFESVAGAQHTNTVYFTGTDLASAAIYSPLSEASADDLFLLSQPATTLDTLLTADYNRHLFHHHLTTVLPPPVNEEDLSPLSL